jgi:hypothetical protein
MSKKRSKKSTKTLLNVLFFPKKKGWKVRKKEIFQVVKNSISRERKPLRGKKPLTWTVGLEQTKFRIFWSRTLNFLDFPSPPLYKPQEVCLLSKNKSSAPLGWGSLLWALGGWRSGEKFFSGRSPLKAQA